MARTPDRQIHTNGLGRTGPSAGRICTYSPRPAGGTARNRPPREVITVIRNEGGKGGASRSQGAADCGPSWAGLGATRRAAATVADLLSDCHQSGVSPILKHGRYCFLGDPDVDPPLLRAHDARPACRRREQGEVQGAVRAVLHDDGSRAAWPRRGACLSSSHSPGRARRLAAATRTRPQTRRG